MPKIQMTAMLLVFATASLAAELNLRFTPPLLEAEIEDGGQIAWQGSVNPLPVVWTTGTPEYPLTVKVEEQALVRCTPPEALEVIIYSDPGHRIASGCLMPDQSQSVTYYREDTGVIFSDGFESSSLARWTASVGD